MNLHARQHFVLVPCAALVVATMTVLNGAGVIALRDLAATPQSVAGGRAWQLLTSALVADHPVVPSIVGFTGVGLAALALSGSRVLWAAAVAGHVGSALAVYGLLDAISYRVDQPDFGTSAVISAWIGVIAYEVRRRRSSGAAVAVCAVAAIVGWLCRPHFDALDTEHAVALAVGVGVAAWLPRLSSAQVRRGAAWVTLLLHDRPQRHRAPGRAGWRLGGRTGAELLRPQRPAGESLEHLIPQVADAELGERAPQDVLAVFLRVEPLAHDLARRAE